jgi:hypothetical protein
MEFIAGKTLRELIGAGPCSAYRRPPWFATGASHVPGFSTAWSLAEMGDDERMQAPGDYSFCQAAQR